MSLVGLEKRCHGCGKTHLLILPMDSACAGLSQALPTVRELAKAMADHIGHGMGEKCTSHAEAALAFLRKRGESRESRPPVATHPFDCVLCSVIGDVGGPPSDVKHDYLAPPVATSDEDERCDCGSLPGQPHINCPAGTVPVDLYELSEDIREIVRLGAFDGRCDKSLRNEVYAKLDALNAAPAESVEEPRCAYVYPASQWTLIGWRSLGQRCNAWEKDHAIVVDGAGWDHAFTAVPPPASCAYVWDDGTVCGETYERGCPRWVKGDSRHLFTAVPPVAREEKPRCDYFEVNVGQCVLTPTHIGWHRFQPLAASPRVINGNAEKRRAAIEKMLREALIFLDRMDERHLSDDQVRAIYLVRKAAALEAMEHE